MIIKCPIYEFMSYILHLSLRSAILFKNCDCIWDVDWTEDMKNLMCVCTVEKHTDSVRHQTLLLMYKDNCCELEGDLRVWALLLHDFMTGVWSVIISNVINTFSTGAVVDSALCECVCFVCNIEKRQLCGGFGGCIFCHSHSSLLYLRMMVCCICCNGATSSTSL